MAHCNACGRYVAPTESFHKRQLYSGTSNSTYYGKRISFGTRKHYSMQSVCSDCAIRFDKSSNTSLNSLYIIFFIIGIISMLIILLIYRN